ncbi:MAG: hypothetical protein IT441_09555 [Phycisphaeraceae bacterium]|nr:hypothetical protein [Phycisphaeraceae bacterium]
MTTKGVVQSAAMSMAAGLLCMAMAPSAWGQQQIEGGHELDKNLQKGSGGINQAVRPQQIGAGNAVITGNVPGLGYFHGDVGYSAPGEFRGSTGEDTTFRFRAQSFNSTLGAPGGGTEQGNVQVYRSTATPGIGQAGGMTSLSSMPNYLTGGAPSAGGVRTMQSGSSGAQSSWTSQSIPTGGMTVSSLGMVAGQDGRMLQISGSALLGLRATAVGTTNQNASGQAGGQSPSVLDSLGTTLPRNPTVSGLGQADSAAARVDATLTPSPTGAAPVDLRQSPLSPHEPTMTLDQQVANIEARLRGPEGSMQAQPGQDVYMDLMRRVRQQKTGEAAPSADAPGAVPQDQLSRPTPAGKPDATGLPQDPLREAMRFEPAKPVEQEQAPAPAEGDKGQDKSELKTDKSAPPTGLEPLPRTPLPAPALPGNPAESAPLPGSGAGRDATDVSVLKYQLPALPSLAGSQDTPANKNLREAERLMQAGQFFEAVDRYRQSSLLNPNDPMIRVGQVHAQMGAGMIRSAAMNLRDLYGAHPELIAARYESRLLPPKSRLEWLAEELEKDLEVTDGPVAEAGLLLAYMGYQTDNTSWLSRGLAAVKQVNPQDELAVLLEVIWASPAPTPEPAEPKTTAPTGPATEAPAEQSPATMPSDQLMLELDSALESAPPVEAAAPQAPEARP